MSTTTLHTLDDHRPADLNQPAPFSPLNLDILCRVMSRTDSRRDLLAIMHTCHDLHTAGIPLFFKHEFRVFGFLDSRLQSFHDLLVFNAPISFTALRSVQFEWFSDAETNDIDLMIDILRRAVNLEHLHIEIDILEEDETIPLTIGSLTKLRSLKLPSNDPEKEDDDEVFTVLSQLHSPLENISIWFSEASPDPIPMLANFRETLKEVYVFNVDGLSSSVCYPHVTRYESFFCFPVKLPALTAAFPNVKELDIDTQVSGPPDLGPLDREMCEICRQENIAFQAQHGDCWNSLVSLKMDLTGLYMMALQREIESLDISLGITCVKDEDSILDWLQSSMGLLRPKRLALPVGQLDFATFVPGALSVGVERLQRLDIYVHIDSESECEALLDVLFRAIECLNILILSCNLSSCSRSPSGSGGEPSEQELFPTQLNMKMFARRAMTIVPSLEFIKFKIVPELEDGPKSYWRIANSDGTRRLIRVPLEDHEAVSTIDKMLIP